MTENKRFTFSGTDEEPLVRDNITGKEYPTEENSLMELLNELHKENQDLATKKEDAEYELLYLKEKYEELLEENGQLKQHLKHSEKRTAIISGWLHDGGNMTLDKYEEILDYCYQEYKNEGLIDSNDKNKIFSDFKNFKLQKDMMEINDMLNEYYTADPSLNIIPKLNALLTELKYHRQASNTVEWQAYKEKEFGGL